MIGMPRANVTKLAAVASHPAPGRGFKMSVKGQSVGRVRPGKPSESWAPRWLARTDAPDQQMAQLHPGFPAGLTALKAGRMVQLDQTLNG